MLPLIRDFFSPQALDMIRVDGPSPSARTSYASTKKLTELHATVSRYFGKGRHDDAIATLPRLLRVVRELRLPVAEAIAECKKIIEYAEEIHRHAGDNYSENKPVLVRTQQEAREYQADLSIL